MDPYPRREYNVLPMWPRLGCTAPPPSQGGMGWVLHATRHTKRSCNGREDGDYDVEDLAPSTVVVECSHSLKLEDPP